jgi:hypothetical protein
MSKEKGQSKEVTIREGQVLPAVTKVIEFGEVPAKLNVASKIVQDGNVSPQSDSGTGTKGAVPPSLLKVPLPTSTQQPSPESSSDSGKSGPASVKPSSADSK